MNQSFIDKVMKYDVGDTKNIFFMDEYVCSFKSTSYTC